MDPLHHCRECGGKLFHRGQFESTIGVRCSKCNASYHVARKVVA